MFICLIIFYIGYVYMINYILQWLNSYDQLYLTVVMSIWWIISYSGYVYMINYILQWLCSYD